MDLGNKDKSDLNKEIDTVESVEETTESVEETKESLEETTESVDSADAEFVDKSYEIPDHEYTELPPDDTPTVKLLKRVGLIVCGIAFLGLLVFISNKIMDRLYPDSLKEVRMKEASAASKDKETEADLNIKIDHINEADAGKSLDELVDGGSALNYGNDYYESMSKASESTDVKESVSDSNNEEVSVGESEGAVSPENEVSEEEINKMVESKIAKDNQPVESQGIGGLEDYYNKQIESANNNESLQADLNELMKKVQ